MSEKLTEKELLWYLDFLEGKVTNAEALNHFFKDDKPYVPHLREIVKWFYQKETPDIISDRDAHQEVIEHNYYLGLKHGMESQQEPRVTKEEISYLIDICVDIANGELPFNDLVIWLKSKGLVVDEKEAGDE